MTDQDRVVETIPLLLVMTRDDVPQGEFDQIIFYMVEADPEVGSKAKVGFQALNPPGLTHTLRALSVTGEKTLLFVGQVIDIGNMIKRLTELTDLSNLTIAFAPRIWRNSDD